MKEQLACQWKPIDQFDTGSLSFAQKRWIIDRGSLTQRLRRFFSREIEFVLQKASLSEIYPDEQQLLTLKTDKKQWVREIMWLKQGVPIVCARVVVPTGYDDPMMKKIYAVGESSVGEVLFGESGFVRAELLFAKLEAAHPYYVMAAKASPMPPPFLWGRSSIFNSASGALLVSEIFLPNFFRSIASADEGDYAD